MAQETNKTAELSINMNSKLIKLDVLEKDPYYTTLKSRNEKFGYFLHKGLDSDVTLCIGHKKYTFYCHKLILAFNSAVFAEIFAKNSDIENIYIEDVEEEQFRIFLKFCYTGRLERNLIKSTDVIPLLRISKKFEVDELVYRCTKMFPKLFSIESAVTVYEQAKKYNEENLAEEGFKFICQNAYLIFDTNEVEKLSESTLKLLLERDDLAAENEYQIYDALLRWGFNKVEKLARSYFEPNFFRSAIDDLIGLIRFPLMTPKEISLKVASNITSIIKTEELLSSILLHFNSPNEVNRIIVGFRQFNTKPRIYYEPSIARTISFADKTGISTKICPSGAFHIRFTVKKRVRVIRMSLNYIETKNNNEKSSGDQTMASKVFKSIVRTNLHGLSLKVLDSENEKTIYKNKFLSNTIMRFPTYSNTTTVDTPFEIEPSIVYKIIIKTKTETLQHELYHLKLIVNNENQALNQGKRNVGFKFLDFNTTLLHSITMLE